MISPHQQKILDRIEKIETQERHLRQERVRLVRELFEEPETTEKQESWTRDAIEKLKFHETLNGWKPEYGVC